MNKKHYLGIIAALAAIAIFIYLYNPITILSNPPTINNPIPMKGISYSIPANWNASLGIVNVGGNSGTIYWWTPKNGPIIIKSPNTYTAPICSTQCLILPTIEIAITSYNTNNFTSPKEWYTARLASGSYYDGAGTTYKETNISNQSAYCAYYPGSNQACYVLWNNTIYGISIQAETNADYLKAEQIVATLKFV
jgi:hypothetical protein